MFLRMLVASVIAIYSLGATVWAIHGNEPFLKPWLRTLMVTLALLSLYGFVAYLHHIGPAGPLPLPIN
jgi:hypothetical protein